MTFCKRCTFILLLAGIAWANEANALRAARKDLREFLASAAQGKGLTLSSSDLALARLGAPLPVLDLKEQALLEGVEDAPSLLSQDTNWFIPALVHKRTVGYLEVVRDQGGDWAAVGFGYAELAERMEYLAPRHGKAYHGIYRSHAAPSLP